MRRWCINIGTHDARAQDGKTALMYAAWRGHAGIARLLLDAGTDTMATDKVRASQSATAVDGCAGVVWDWRGSELVFMRQYAIFQIFLILTLQLFAEVNIREGLERLECVWCDELVFLISRVRV